MSEVKTKKNEVSVEGFLNTIKDEEIRKDCYEIVKMMKKASKEEPKMWGSSIVGFGSYHYKYESGREGDSMMIGFSPRKQNITLYIAGDGFEQYQGLMNKLGKHSIGKGCLYIKKLEDVDTAVLNELVTESLKARKLRHSS